MKRTREQRLQTALLALDRLAADLTRSGLRGYARRLRGARTSVTNFVYSEKSIPQKVKLSRANQRRVEGLGLERIIDMVGDG